MISVDNNNDNDSENNLSNMNNLHDDDRMSINESENNLNDVQTDNERTINDVMKREYELDLELITMLKDQITFLKDEIKYKNELIEKVISELTAIKKEQRSKPSVSVNSDTDNYSTSTSNDDNERPILTDYMQWHAVPCDDVIR